MEQSPSLEANRFSPTQEILHIYGTQRFITAFTFALQLALSWASSIHSIPLHPTSWRSILLLSSDLRLDLPSSLFPSGVPTNTLYAPLLSPIRATCPTHLIFLDLITRTILGEQYRSLSSSLCNFLHYPVTSSLLGPNTLLNTLFSNTLSLRFSHNVSEQFSHPYKTGLILNSRHLNLATRLQISIQWWVQNIWSVTYAFLIRLNATILRHRMNLRFILKPCGIRGFTLPPRCHWGLRSSLMLRGVGWCFVTDVSVHGPVFKGLLDLWGWGP